MWTQLIILVKILLILLLIIKGVIENTQQLLVNIFWCLITPTDAFCSLISVQMCCASPSGSWASRSRLPCVVDPQLSEPRSVHKTGKRPQADQSMMCGAKSGVLASGCVHSSSARHLLLLDSPACSLLA